MPIQMVLRDVEHRRRRGIKAVDAIELEARKLQHPDLRPGRQVTALEAASSKVSSIDGPTLPAIATLLPQRSTIKAVRAVVVVLPFVPEMAMTWGA